MHTKQTNRDGFFFFVKMRICRRNIFFAIFYRFILTSHSEYQLICVMCIESYSSFRKHEPHWTYLWITILRQDLQHRRFSALNVSHKNQFTSDHQRLSVSPFLHGGNKTPAIRGEKNEEQSAEQPRKLPSVMERPGVRLAEDAQLIWLNLPLRLFIEARSSQ